MMQHFPVKYLLASTIRLLLACLFLATCSVGAFGQSISGEGYHFKLGPADDRGYRRIQFKYGDGWWTDLGDLTVEQYTVAKNANGQLEIYAIGTSNADFRVYRIVETGREAWAYPEIVGDFTANERQIAVGATSDGKLCVVAKGSNQTGVACPPTSPKESWIPANRGIEKLELYIDYSAGKKLTSYNGTEISVAKRK